LNETQYQNDRISPSELLRRGYGLLKTPKSRDFTSPLKSILVFFLPFIGFLPSAYAQDNLLNLSNEFIPYFQDLLVQLVSHPEKILSYLFIIVILSFLLKVLMSFLGKWESASHHPNGIGNKYQIKQMKKEARHFEKQRDFLRAGEIYEHLNEYEKAKQNYQRGKGHLQVGRICEKLKQWDQAAAFYELGQSLENAARNYQKGKNFQKAGEIYFKVGKGLLAGEMYESGKNFLEAGRMYEKANYFQKSGWMYLSAKENLKAAEMFEKYFLQEHHKVKNSTLSDTNGQQNVLTGYAKKSGELYLVLGKYKEAARIFVLGGFFEEAAEALSEAGEYQRAAELFVEVKEFDKAAEVLREGGDERQGDYFIGEKYAREERYSEAAYYFEQAHEFNQAGEMYERSGDMARAGEMFFKGEDYSKSSELFLAIGDKRWSAQALEKAQRLKEAAQLYRELKDFDQAVLLYKKESLFFEAARLRKEQGNIEESILLLQKVGPENEDYSEATLALATLFRDKGMYGPSLEKYQRALSGKPICSETIESYYQLALLQEEHEDYESAISLFERILAEDIQFRDVPERLKNLEKIKSEKHATVKKNGDAPTQVVESRYKLIREIGRGGMGLVYQAEDLVLKRRVAYKILSGAVRENPKALENFLQEARTAASIQHPNIVTIYDTGQCEGDYYIAMEYVDGVTLKQLLGKTSLLSLEDVLLIFKQVCTGLEYAHSQHVIHRDIKPGNIMISRDKVVKIMDFGLAKIVHDCKGETTEVKGTPLYMSPEQILGRKVDHQSDIYSLGCTMFRMVTGKPPFSGGDVFYQHLHKTAPEPSSLNSQVPDYLNRIILKCLEKNKPKRYADVKEIFQDFSIVEKK